MSPLLQQQLLFVQNLGFFLTWLTVKGYKVTMGECWRSDETAKLNAAEGKGIANSLHRLRLAQDLNLILSDGTLAQTVDDYRPLGVQWLTYHRDNRWGGNFTKPDADHFSMGWQGVQ